MTQRERYYNDPEFHVLVDYMVNFIVNNKYTPSEMRDAAILASIIYDEKNIRINHLLYKNNVDRFLDSLIQV